MEYYIGTNYHPHDWPRERWGKDIELMKKAGFTTVRLGHLCWDSYEPEEGVYTFEWFDEVMDLFADAGISVLLDISVRPAPVWVHKLCPGCNIYSKSGNYASSIRRYMEDVDDPAYQKYALRFAEVLVGRYKEHKALFAFGLCNELGAGFMSFSDHALQRFQNWLKRKYKTIDQLNDAWATRRWSRRRNSFDEIEFPMNELTTGAPEPYLDMRRFYSDGIGNFIVKLAKSVEKNAPNAIHSSNHYSGKVDLGFDYLKYADQFVDYPGIGFYPGYDMDNMYHYCDTVHKERMAEIEKPMWCLEFQTGKEGIICGPKGYLRMQAHLRILNRTQMILGWTWRSMLAGEEQYYIGILGHDGYPTPNYEEMKQVASDMKSMEEHGVSLLKKPEIAVAYNQENWWVQLSQPGHFRQLYTDAIVEINKAFFMMNQDYNMVDLRNLKKNYRLLLVPNNIEMEPKAAATIREYVESGGTVVMTGYSGTVDETGKVFSTKRPGLLWDVFGIRVSGFRRTEMECLHTENSIVVERNGKKRELYKVTKEEDEMLLDVEYLEELELHGAESFAEIKENSKCMISKHTYGRGTAYYIASESNAQIVEWLMKYLIKELGIEDAPTVPEGIQARKITEHVIYYINTTKQTKKITLQQPGISILNGSSYEQKFLLEPFGVEIIAFKE